MKTQQQQQESATGDMDSGRRYLELEYRYDDLHSLGNSGSVERKPMIVAFTTLPREEGQPPAYHRHLLHKATGNRTGAGSTKYTSVRVDFPYPEGQVWRQDSSIGLLLMTQIPSSENQWPYAKTASAKVLVAQLMAKQEALNQKGKASGTFTVARDQSAWMTVPFKIQSYYMPVPGKDDEALVQKEQHKGNLQVRLVDRSASRGAIASIRWASKSKYDLTPVNKPSQQAAMMMAVTRGLSPFSPEIVGNHALTPDFEELHNVHAPLNVQESGIDLDGATFWSRVPDLAQQHVAHHGGQQEAAEYLDVLLKQSLARHNMTRKSFYAAALRFQHSSINKSSYRPAEPDGSDGTAVSDGQVLRAVSVLATACTMRGNMMRYVADKAVLAQSKETVTVESFDQVDIRTGNQQDSGGVRSWDSNKRHTSAVSLANLHHLGASHLQRRWKSKISGSKYRDSVERDRNEAVGGAGDCEDLARDAAVHFTLIADNAAGIPDSAIRNYPVLAAARQIAHHYRAMGVLSSVLSRNLADAQQSRTSNAGGQSQSFVQPTARCRCGSMGGVASVGSFVDAASGEDQEGTSMTSGSTPPIGSVGDRRVQVGAHMFTLLVPKRMLQVAVARAVDHARPESGTSVGFKDIDLGMTPPSSVGAADTPTQNRYETVPASTPLSRGRGLPVALCEGTGILHPLMLPQEHYATAVQDKLDRATRVVMDQEAQVRMRTAKTSSELAAAMVMMTDATHAARSSNSSRSRGGAQPTSSASSSPGLMLRIPPAMDRFMPMHEQDQLLDDPDQRIVPTFYRNAAEMYLVPTANQLRSRRKRGRVAKPHRLTGDRLIPIQIGSRSSVRKDPRTLRWGLPVSDILRQRRHVAFLPTPEPHPDETHIVDSVYRHTAPAVDLHLDKHLDRDPYLAQAGGWVQSVKRWKQDRGYTTVPVALKQLHLQHTRTEVFQRYSLVHAYAHPRDMDSKQEIADMMRWLHTKNPHVVAADIKFERSTYRLAMLRLDVLVDAGSDTWSEVSSKLVPVFRKRAIEKPVRIARPIGSCALPRQGRFENIMMEHIRLTRDYVVKSWENRFVGTDLPLNNSAVQALIQQFQEWATTIDARVSPVGWQRYRAALRTLTDKQWQDDPSPGQLWASELIRDHTVYAKNLADAAWYPNDPEQKRKKAKALQDITSLNNERIGTFWIAVLDDQRSKKAVRELWNSHLTCTAAYIDKLQETGDPSVGSEFDDLVQDCLEKGRKFGVKIDVGMKGYLF